MPTRVSLNELQLAGVRLVPAEVAAIVVEICRQHEQGRLRGIPSANVIRFTEDGGVVAEGPINADGPVVEAAAQLLDDLLPGFEAPPELRSPGGLRLAVARALGSLDLPPFESLAGFAAAIERFALSDFRVRARELFELGSDAVEARRGSEPEPSPAADVEPLPTLRLTISDVRRARRATGLSLDEISARTRIPTALLRELEWGYFRNWPGGLYGRTQLVRYARAAGLDEHVVVQVAQPMIDAAAETQQTAVTAVVVADEPGEELVPVGPQTVQVAADFPLSFPPAPTVDASAPVRRSTRRGLKGALATAALVTLVVAPAAWLSGRHSLPAQEPTTASQIPLSSEPISMAPAAVTLADHQASDPQKPGGSSLIASRQKVHDGPLSTISGRSARVDAEPAGFAPTFSNTGTAVFFHDEAGTGSTLISGDRTQPGAILKITRIIDDNAQNFHARPSPDGSRIAFDSDREGTRAVFVADADGQHVKRMSGDGFAALPSWAPNGHQLAFVKAESDKPRVWNIWTADLDDGQLRRITSYEDGQPWGGSWFPDGRRLAYGHEGELVVIDLETGARQTFPTPIDGRVVRSPAVSPDGRRIIFQVDRDGAWLLDVRNGSMRRVIDDPAAEEYAWSPDGRRVAFHSRRAGGWGVWVMGQ